MCNIILQKETVHGTFFKLKERSTSTVTTFSEVNAGVAAGGRTGLTSVFRGIFFFITMFPSPIAQLIPGCATAAALSVSILTLTH